MSHTFVIILTCLVVTAFAAVELPLLMKQDLAQPCLSVSYASSTNVSVKTKTDAKNAQLVQAGENSIFFSVGTQFSLLFSKAAIQSFHFRLESVRSLSRGNQSRTS